jgi:hypothetical protein
MKRQGQEHILQELEGKTAEEVGAYWERAHQQMLAWQAEARARQVAERGSRDER